MPSPRPCKMIRQSCLSCDGLSGFERFRGGLVFKAHRFVHHSTLGLRVIKKKKNLGSNRPSYSVPSARLSFPWPWNLFSWNSPGLGIGVEG